jgi:phosphate transport system substrate-binding protein
MRRVNGLAVVAAALALFGAGPAEAQLQLNGAGATFPYPMYSKWFSLYTQIDPSARFNYQSIGSGGGIKQITEQTVDFGASDGPMSNEQLAAAPADHARPDGDGRRGPHLQRRGREDRS